MSYGISFALQEAVFAQLSGDAALGVLVGADIFDAPPAGPLPELYVILGDEKVREASDVSGAGAWHDLTVSVVTEAAGFSNAKQTAAAISDALNDADLSLTRGQLIGLQFLRARARREQGGSRRIDLIFRARVEDD